RPTRAPFRRSPGTTGARGCCSARTPASPACSLCLPEISRGTFSMSLDSTPLFQPIKLGDIALPNRVAMAPLTRNRAISPNTVPSPLAPLYYAQRASAGLLITEASQISQQGQGYAWTPGCFTD